MEILSETTWTSLHNNLYDEDPEFLIQAVQHPGPVSQTKQKTIQKNSKPPWMNNLVLKASLQENMWWMWTNREKILISGMVPQQFKSRFTSDEPPSSTDEPQKSNS